MAKYPAFEQLSDGLWSPRFARVPPVDPVDQAGHLGSRYRDHAVLRGRPDKPSALKPLDIQRQPNIVGPQYLDQITLPPTKEIEIAAVRVTLQTMLYLPRQCIHPASHVGLPQSDPDPCSAGKRDHRSSTPSTSRSATGSTSLPTITLCPLRQLISIRPAQASSLQPRCPVTDCRGELYDRRSGRGYGASLWYFTESAARVAQEV